MKFNPEKPANAALFFHPDAVESGGPRLMGRHAAGEGFLKGFVRHSEVEDFYCLAGNQTYFDDFRSRIAAIDSRNRECHWIPVNQHMRLADVGCLWLPGPDLSGSAWRRRALDQRAYSLCGVNHTIASDRIMDALGAYLTSPVQPWDALICTSSAVKATVRRLVENWAEYINQRTGGSVAVGLQLPVIPLGVDCDAFALAAGSGSARAEMRAEHGIGDDDVAVLFVGRLSYHAKAHPLPMYLALEAAAQRTGKTVHLIQAGWVANEGIETEFRQGAAEFCPSVKCIFLDGRQPEVRNRVWHAADIFCSLSDNIQETFGLTPIEAMAAGLPSVVSDWDGYRDTVRNGLDGFLIPAWMPPAGAGHGLELPVAGELNDEERDRAYNHYCGYVSQATAIDVPACIEAFVTLIGNSELRKSMGDAARIRARESFDWRVVVAAYQALWRELSAIREAAPEIAPVAAGRPAYPLRDDPFAIFAAYPTPSRGNRFAVVPVDGAEPSRLKDLLSRPMNTFASELLPSASEMEALVRRLADSGPTTVKNFVEDEPIELRASAARGVGWLAKAGMIRVLPFSDEGDRPQFEPDMPLADRVLASEDRWRKRLQTDPNDVEALKGMTDVARVRGDGTAMARFIGKALEQQPDDPDLHVALGDVLAGLSEWEKAAASFLRAAMARPASARAWGGFANACFARGDRRRAVDAYLRAVRIAPDTADLWFGLGIVLRHEGQSAAALECFDKYESIAGLHTNVQYHRGLANRSAGNLQTAEENISQALELDPSNGFAAAAAASLAASRRMAEGPGRQSVARIAVHMNQGFHYSILRPLFDECAADHEALFTGDMRELVEFEPDVVVVCDTQSANLRTVLPDAKFVLVRHGLISKNNVGTAAAEADYTCVSSETICDSLIEAGVSADRLWVTGYIQMDPLFRGDTLPVSFDLPAANKTVLFAPTYNPMLSAAPMLGPDIVKRIRGDRTDITVVIKPHPHICVHQREWMGWWRTAAAENDNVFLVDDAGADLVPFLLAADVLVSDASSAAFQFLALDRPIVLVTNPAHDKDPKHFDPDGIEWKWRDLGEEIGDAVDLAAAVDRALADPDAAADRRADYRKRLFAELTDGLAAKRIVEKITGLGK
jgi:glycosyltransferase involved in cell wall biosynthesis/tetratricopeptide (TPR) repeat protein